MDNGECRACHIIKLVEDELKPKPPMTAAEKADAFRQLHPHLTSAMNDDQVLHNFEAHPDWEYATTTGQRKAWDDANTPPEGDGWERNVDAGRDGWERFDYTEESYWRRRKGAAA